MNYNKNVCEKAMQELQHRKFEAEDTQKKHLKEIEKSYPHIYEIYLKSKKSIADAFSSVWAKTIEEHDESLGNWKQQREKIKKELEQALIKEGYPSDYLNIKYHCPKCEDNGYKESYMCDCMKELLKLYSSQEINEKSGIQLKDFDDFDFKYYSDKENPHKLGYTIKETMQEIFNECRDYADRAATQDISESLLFFGRTGLGKTFLSSCIAKRVLESGKSVIFNSCINIIEPIENEHFGRAENKGCLSDVINCDLLIIDDLGSEFSSPFAETAFYNIVNSRINKEKPTVISTNCTPEQLRNLYGARVYSRLKGEYQWFTFVGEDIRSQKNADAKKKQ